MQKISEIDVNLNAVYGESLEIEDFQFDSLFT